MLLFKKAKAAKFGFIFIFRGEGGRSEKLLALSAAFHQKKNRSAGCVSGLFIFESVVGV